MTTKTTMTESSPRPTRRPLLGAAVLGLLVLVAACTSDREGAAPTSTPVTVGQDAQDQGTPVTTTAVQAESTPPETTISVDPDSELAQGLAALEAGYQFRSETTVNGETAVVVEGRWLSGNSELTIASGDGLVDYVFVGDHQWVRSPNGDWVEVESSGQAGNPLAALAGPLVLELLDASPSRVLMEGTYAGGDFDLDVAEVDVAILLAEGALSEASFTVESDGNIAESRTVFAQLANISPITAPAS